MSPTALLFAAAALLAAWLVLLLLGHAFGGATHLLALAGVVAAVRGSRRAPRPGGNA